MDSTPSDTPVADEQYAKCIYNVFYADTYIDIMLAHLVLNSQLFPVPSGSILETVPEMVIDPAPILVCVGLPFAANIIERFALQIYSEIVVVGSSHKERYESPKVKYVEYADMRENINMVPSYAASVLVEHALISDVPGYTTPTDITSKQAANVRAGLIAKGNNMGQLVLYIANSIKGFQVIEDIMSRGEILDDLKKSVACERVRYQQVKYRIGDLFAVAVYCSEFIEDVRREITKEYANLRILYRFVHKGDDFGAEMNIISGGGENICELLGVTADYIRGPTDIILWQPMTGAKKILRFLDVAPDRVPDVPETLMKKAETEPEKNSQQSAT